MAPRPVASWPTGGGIFNDGGSTGNSGGNAILTITNSTISGNSVGFHGGGIYNHGINIEHHGFTGWVVSATRRNKRFTRYFSDQDGQRKALRAARVYRDKLLSRLPPPKKIRIKDKRNTTGVIGVCRQEYREKSAKWFVRYIAEWLKNDDTRASASFSVNLYGEEDAFELAVYCRRKGLRELGLPRAYYERVSDNKCG
jgi:hypothetical protein